MASLLTWHCVWLFVNRTIKVEVYDWDRDGRWVWSPRRAALTYSSASNQSRKPNKTWRKKNPLISSYYTMNLSQKCSSVIISSNHSPCFFFVLTDVFSWLSFTLPATTSSGTLQPATGSSLEGRASSMYTRWVVRTSTRTLCLSSWDPHSLSARCLGPRCCHRWHFYLWHHCCTITYAHFFLYGYLLPQRSCVKPDTHFQSFFFPLRTPVEQPCTIYYTENSIDL